jgi:hypothetical protein
MLVSIVQHQWLTTIVVHVAVSVWCSPDIKIGPGADSLDLATSNPTSSLGFPCWCGDPFFRYE